MEHQERQKGDFPSDPGEYLEFAQSKKTEVVAGWDLQHGDTVGRTSCCTGETAFAPSES